MEPAKPLVMEEPQTPENPWGIGRLLLAPSITSAISIVILIILISTQLGRRNEAAGYASLGIILIGGLVLSVMNAAFSLWLGYTSANGGRTIVECARVGLIYAIIVNLIIAAGIIGLILLSTEHNPVYYVDPIQSINRLISNELPPLAIGITTLTLIFTVIGGLIGGWRRKH